MGNVFENKIITNDDALINGAKLLDPMREHYPKPCADCGRDHLNGEHVCWQVPDNPNNQGSMRTVWEGCIDCYIRRTNPHGKVGS